LKLIISPAISFLNIPIWNKSQYKLIGPVDLVANSLDSRIPSMLFG
jgi:hypothetical protein